MNTTNSVVATAAIVTIGKWANDDEITPRVAVGAVFLAMALVMMEQGSPKLASKFALLIFVVAAFMYIPGIAYKAGLTNTKVEWGGMISQPKAGRIRR